MSFLVRLFESLSYWAFKMAYKRMCRIMERLYPEQEARAMAHLCEGAKTIEVMCAGKADFLLSVTVKPSEEEFAYDILTCTHNDPCEEKEGDQNTSNEEYHG